MRKEFWRIYKDSVNFFKHADKDSDKSIDISAISRRNELQTLLNIVNYSEIFGPDISSHMRAYLLFIAAEYPNVLNDVPGLPKETQDAFNAATKWSRQDRMSSLSAAIELTPDFQRERDDDHRVTRYLERLPDRD